MLALFEEFEKNKRFADELATFGEAVWRRWKENDKVKSFEQLLKLL